MDGDSQWRTKISQPAVRKSEQFLVENVTFASPLSKCIREICTKGNDTIRWSQYRRLPNVVRRVRNGRHLTAADHEDKYQLSQMDPRDALPQAHCAVDGRSVWTTGRRPSQVLSCTFVDLSWQHVATIVVSWQKYLSLESGQSSKRCEGPYFWRCLNVVKTQCGIGQRKFLCENPARFIYTVSQ